MERSCKGTCISVLSQICRRQLLAAGQDSRAAHHSRSLLWIDTQLALDDLRRFLGVVMPERDRSAFRLYIAGDQFRPRLGRSEEHTSELQSLMRISYAVFCLKKKKQH